ncbi:hypothetical protein GOBAR_DD28982 [Gossypium barbadense]|nr:hypothetical protein GOBAR_DD28982 [Gossypium barbadense]
MIFDRNVSVGDMKKKVPKASVDRRSFVCGFDINLNVGCSDQHNGGLQIYPVVIETNALGEDECNNNGFSDHKCEDFNDPDLDDVPYDIDDEGPDDGNDHAPSIGNPSCGIIIHNDPGTYMPIVDPDATHASEFPEYPDIIPTHLMLADPESEELFMGKRFTSKDECINAIK